MTITKSSNEKKYDLEERTREFAKMCRKFLRTIRRSFIEIEDGKQLTRASGSVAANYIEANEALSRKDFIYRIKICRKEAKESEMWLNLFEVNSDKDLNSVQKSLIQEAYELRKIFGAIVTKMGH